MIHAGEEAEKFKTLTLDFMSEESDPDDDGSMAVHQPQWRSNSKELNTHFYFGVQSNNYLLYFLCRAD